jgi:hypothetical protein
MQVLTGVAFAVVFAAARQAAAGELLAGIGREDITPPAGFPNLLIKDAKFEEVLSPLYARALVLGDGTRKIALLQWDLCSPGNDAVATVRRLVSAATGIPASNILVHASHTHSAPFAPGVSDNKDDPTLDARLNEQPSLNKEWTDRLFSASVTAAKTANTSLQPVTLEVGRAIVPEWQYNRRPRRPDGTVETIFVPTDPYTMPDGLRFGPMDPTLTTLVFKNSQQSPVVTLFNYPLVACSVYPTPEKGAPYVGSKAISADWPGFATDQIETNLGGRAIFLQGCAGDLVPARRGVEASKEMGALIGARAVGAATRGLRIDVNRLETNSSQVGLPWKLEMRAEKGTDLNMVEVQVFVLGSVAIVTLPGEPMIEIAMAIQKESPYPHTIVLGFSNGDGMIYVGMPGEKARGGFGAERWANGTDDCGTLMVETSLRLLREIAAR